MLEVIGKQAKDASRKLAVLGSVRKNESERYQESRANGNESGDDRPSDPDS